MTLVELVVTIGLLAIVSVLVVVAYPAQREHQKLISAEQKIQSVLRQAQQMALDQRREYDCVITVPEEDENLCSKVGVAFTGNAIIFFADTNDSNTYDTNDFKWPDMRTALPDTVTFTHPGTNAFLFEANPPTVAMWANGQPAFGSDDPTVVVLQTDSGQQRTLGIHSYAQVEVIN